MQKKYLYFGLLLVFLNITLSASAQSDVQVSRALDNDKMKNVSQARFLSLSNTALSVATGLAAVNLFENNTVQTAGAWLGAYGVIMGPATGNMYAVDYPRAFIGVAARAAGSYLMIDATREILGDKFANQFNVDKKEVSLTDTKILIGQALILGGFVYNVLSSKKSVEEFNAGRKQLGLNVTPTVVEDKVAPTLTATFNF